MENRFLTPALVLATLVISGCESSTSEGPTAPERIPTYAVGQSLKPTRYLSTDETELILQATDERIIMEGETETSEIRMTIVSRSSLSHGQPFVAATQGYAIKAAINTVLSDAVPAYADRGTDRFIELSLTLMETVITVAEGGFVLDAVDRSPVTLSLAELRVLSLTAFRFKSLVTVRVGLGVLTLTPDQAARFNELDAQFQPLFAEIFFNWN